MGLINIYNTISNEHSKFKANGKIKDVLPEFDYSKAMLLKAGERITEDYEIKEDDVIYVRLIPGSTAAVAITIAVIGVVAAGVSIGVSVAAQKKAKDEMDKAQRNSKNMSSPVEKLPFLRGAQNKRALGFPIQYVIGRTYNSGYSLIDGYYSIGGKDGEKQYWTTVLSAGFKGLIFEKLYSGNEIIQEWNDTTPQSGSYGTNPASVYHDEENIIELCQNGQFKNDFFKKKVVGTLIGSELKNPYDNTRDKYKEYIIKQCENNTMKVEVCIEFPSLRRYNNDSESWGEYEVTVTPEWSNGETNPDGSVKWNTDGFYFAGTTGEWVEADADKINELIAAGKLSKFESEHNGWEWVEYTSLSNDVKIESQGYAQTDKVLYSNLEGTGNQIQRNSNHTIRFVATKTFTAAESFNKTIKVRLSRSMKAQNNTQEDCYFLYMNCYCYDGKKSSNNNLVPALVYERPEDLALIGMKFIANDSTQNILKEFNAITTGIAPDINTDGTLSEEKANRNPVSWIYKILTSSTHRHSQFSDDEINVKSFYDAWHDCEVNQIYVDGIVTAAIKKRDLLTKLLKVINGTLYYNADGLLELAVDKKETTPVALLNSENISSVLYAKELNRKPTGIKLTFTNNENWEIDTRYVMLDGSDTHTVDDIITEMPVEFVTDPATIYKIGQRTMREQILQPMTITADIGREGDYYPLYSLVLVQLPQFKQGLASSVIQSLIKNSAGDIIGFNIADEVKLPAGENYGAVIYAVTPEGKHILSRQIFGDAITRTLRLETPISAEDAPEVGNTISIGLLNADGSFSRVTNKYKIYGISRNDNNGLKLTLKPYSDELYEFGTIPEFKSNLTPTTNNSASVPGITQSQLNQSLDTVRTVTNIESYYALGTQSETAPEKSSFSKNVPTMTQNQRFLWSFTRYIYKDGSFKDTNIILTGVYGEQGTPGSGYRLDISPDSTTVFANQNGAATVPSIQFGAYFFFDTEELTAQTTYTAYINDEVVGSWNGPIVTIPTSKLALDTTQIKIVAQYNSISRTSFCTATKVYGNTIYQLLPSTQNVKVLNNGTVVPELVTITKQKITNTGYYQASEDEGVVYGRVIPGGELQKIGYYEVQEADVFDNTKQYCSQFEPFMLSVETDPDSGDDIIIGDEENNALIFFTRQ